jgi:hypothetical protein
VATGSWLALGVLGLFEFEWQDGSRTRTDELAYQRRSGERVVEETFFDDPAQLIPRKPTVG